MTANEEKLQTFEVKDLVLALAMLGRNGNPELNESVASAQLTIAKELISRGVVFWDSVIGEEE